MVIPRPLFRCAAVAKPRPLFRCPALVIPLLAVACTAVVFISGCRGGRDAGNDASPAPLPRRSPTADGSRVRFLEDMSRALARDVLSRGRSGAL